MWVERGSAGQKGEVACDQSRVLEATAQSLQASPIPGFFYSSHGSTSKLSRKAEGEMWARVGEGEVRPQHRSPNALAASS